MISGILILIKQTLLFWSWFSTLISQGNEFYGFILSVCSPFPFVKVWIYCWFSTKFSWGTDASKINTFLNDLWKSATVKGKMPFRRAAFEKVTPWAQQVPIWLSQTDEHEWPSLTCPELTCCPAGTRATCKGWWEPGSMGGTGSLW